MLIVPTYDTSVTNPNNPAPPGFIPAVIAAVQLVETLFSDPIIITLQVGWGDENGNQITNPNAIGQSEPNWVIGGDYGQIRDLLIADETSPNDATAVNALPLNDPAVPARLR
jgi:hypothetical protein